MDYLLVGLLLLILGNLIYLERTVSRLNNEVKHIKKSLEEAKDG